MIRHFTDCLFSMFALYIDLRVKSKDKVGQLMRHFVIKVVMAVQAEWMGV